MASTFKLDYAGVGELLRSEGMRAVIAPFAERTLAAAQSGAPVESGAYRASLHIEHTTTDRVRERVVASVPYAMEVEADTGNLARSL